jgi:hypothetical protein
MIEGRRRLGAGELVDLLAVGEIGVEGGGVQVEAEVERDGAFTVAVMPRTLEVSAVHGRCMSCGRLVPQRVARTGGVFEPEARTEREAGSSADSSLLPVT